MGSVGAGEPEPAQEPHPAIAAADGGVPGGGGGAQQTAATVVLPATIGPYVVMRPLGGGGMGVVSLCRAASGRLVAVKQVREEYAGDPAFRSRFRREVAAARRVSGVYTVAVVDADTEAPRPWVASAYVAGPTLDQAVRICGSFREPALRALGTGLAEALAAVHGAGLVHRDLKPQNVLLAGDGPRVIDFGISRALDETRMTGTGTVLGSPAFMAPEQITSAHDVGPAGDVFALAGLLVYAACGEGPFGTADEGALHRVMTAEPDLTGVPAPLQPLLQHCLDKTPSRRPTLDDVLRALAPADPDDLLVPALREDLAVRARDAALMAVAPPPPALVPGSGRPARRIGRRGALIGGLGLLGALAAGGGVLALRGAGTDDPKDPGGAKPLGTKVRTVQLTAPPAPLWTQPGPANSVMPDLRAFGPVAVLHDAAYTTAFDAASGAVRWSHTFTTGNRAAQGGSDPLTLKDTVLGLTDGKVLVSRLDVDAAGVHYGLTTVDPGTARTRSKGADLPQAATPAAFLAASGDTVYCLTTAFSQDPLHAKPGTGTTPDLRQSAVAADLATGTIRWQQPFKAPTAPSTACFGADRRGFYHLEDTAQGLTVHALDAARGTARWSIKVPAEPDSSLPDYMKTAGSGLTSALTLADDVLITLNFKGGLTAYDTADGHRLWSVPMTAGTPPVVVGALVLTNTTSGVYAIDLRTGAIKWRVESPVQLSPFSFLGRTIAASEQVTAVLFSAFKFSGDGTTSSGAGGCLALRTSDGKELWAVRENTGTPGAPVPSLAPSPSGTGGTPKGLDMWSVAVAGSTVFLSGGGHVRAYRADAAA
ncbi:PQQ-binding-like beta-propeller repeat protein [Streptomyces sp. NPDC048111]|uniref:serine/threonine-protein kinase n=1 Tax=Streptomyces sp. NPDC048111 TaxID=3365500 RepID=UPI0037153B4B